MNLIKERDVQKELDSLQVGEIDLSPLSVFSSLK